jgi:uncharacterized protein with beta-barrel porin domain
MKNVWACPGGITAAAGRPMGLRFRDAFLGTVAAGALSLAFAGPALAGPAACTPSGGGTIETCSGNQSAGIASGIDFTAPPVTTLNVNNLTQAITPASGTGGISFISAGDITITSNTGAFGITTTGAGAFGIEALSLFGAVTVTSTGNIGTTGSTAIGIAAASFGGGAVTVTSTGNITTAGRNAFGISAYATSGAVRVTSTGNITTAGNYAAGIFAESNGAGAVTVTSIGNIATAGGSAFGIYAKSTGGGAVTVTSTGNVATKDSFASGIVARGYGAGAVTVTSTGNIATAGFGAYGIFAQSTGAGAVTVTSTGNISTAGAGALGIFAQGNGTGAVTVTSTGNITTAGSNAIGIFAESTGGPVAVTIKSGTVSGGSGSGAGVDLVGGTNNTLSNFGTVTALSGLAIKGNTGNNTVNNFGTVIGNVILGSGSNAFNNMAGGLFDSGATVNLGAGNTLTNAGTLSPGGAGVIQTTALTGNLVQTATGRLFTDINLAGATSDRVNVSGTASLAGAVQVQVLNPAFGAFQQTIVSAAGGATNNGLALLASPALQAQLVFPNATDVAVKSTGINFVTPGLNNNQTSLGNALNGAGHADGLGGPVFNFLLNGITSVPAYNLALTQLTGEAATGSQQTTFDAMNLFMGTMLDPSSRGMASAPGGGVSGYASEGDASAYASTKDAGTARDAYAMFTKAPPAAFEQRWSVWAAGFGGSQNTDGNATVGSNTATSSVFGTAVGADYRISPYTIAGFALAGGGTNFSVAGSGFGHSDLFQAGAFVKHTVGQAYISAALAYGWQDITTNRTVTAAGTSQLRAQFDANAFSGRLEGGYRFVAPWVGGIGITPYAAAQFTTFDLPVYAEQAIVGSNAFALAYNAKAVTDTRSELGIRADKSFAMTDGILMLRGRVAWAHDYDPDRSIATTFQSLPGASFVVNGAAQAADSALVTASIEKKWLNGWSAAATFEGEFSDVTRSYAGKGMVRYAW